MPEMYCDLCKHAHFPGVHDYERPPKYAVLKWEDWRKLVGGIVSFKEWDVDGLLLQDAEVIRGQDVTAAPVFHAYASIINSFSDLLASRGVQPVARHDDLLAIADHFHEAALRSEARADRKLPD